MLKINFADNTYLVEITPDTMLSELVARAGIMLDLRCAGFGVCGRCQVELRRGEFVIEGKSAIIGIESPLIAPACHTQVCGPNAEITIPTNSVVHSDGQIAVDYEHIHKTANTICQFIQIQPPREFSGTAKSLAELFGAQKHYWSTDAVRQLGSSYNNGEPVWLAELCEGDSVSWIAAVRKQPFAPLGIAIDIGTTTVAVVLLDLEKGEPLASVSAYNRQAACGDNVSSRISYSLASAGNLQRLRNLIVKETINPLLRQLFADTGRLGGDVVKVSVAGNTVMTHLFMGISPHSIGILPFLPTVRTFLTTVAAETELDVNPAAQLSILPAISGYIGGDITAGIIASGVDLSKKRALLIDIGTNCEIVLCDGQKLYACAAAAGPAFEGAGIACGSRAATGAIDRIQIDDQLHFTVSTIDNASPAGLCGSAIIDFLAEGFKCGMIDSFGRYNLEMLQRSGHYLGINYGHSIIHSCVVGNSSNGKPIYVSEADIEQVLKAKAAVYAGIKALLEQCEMSICELEIVYLAGGFARYMCVESAISMGMLPPLNHEKYHKIGNSSLAGAVMNVIDPAFLTRALALIDQPKIVELNFSPDFENHYIDALMIPHFNPEEFAAL